MDIVQRLRKDAAALENGPYTSIKEAREVMREAARVIESLRIAGISDPEARARARFQWWLGNPEFKAALHRHDRKASQPLMGE